MDDYSFTTPHGIELTRTVSQVNFRRGLWRLLRDLDQYRGIYLSSGYESPRRYSRWGIGSGTPAPGGRGSYAISTNPGASTFPRDTSLRGDIRAGISARSTRRWRLFPTTGASNSA